MTEAVYHGVPILGIPIFGDQKMNVARMVKHGIGYGLHYKDINERSYSGAIQTILESPS